MRHGKKFNHLGRQKGHRRALLSNMASSLIEHKKINTTVAKAKALRKYVEPLITKAKTDSMQSRRIVFGYLQSKEAIKELFSEVAPKVANRPGGYTRILRTGNRLGDNAEMCLIELVDFNESYITEAPKKKSRRKKATKKAAPAAEVAEEVVEAPVEETPAIEDAVVEDVKVEEVPAVEEAAEETTTEAKAEEATEEKQEESTEEEKKDEEGK